MRDELKLKAESDVEEVIKKYLKNNLSIELDWKGGGNSYMDESEKLVIKLMLEDEQVFETTAHKP